MIIISLNPYPIKNFLNKQNKSQIQDTSMVLILIKIKKLENNNLILLKFQ